MRTVNCDICDGVIEGDALKVEVLDGEHPHNGSTMTKTIDACLSCGSKMELKCNEEYQELIRRINK